MKTVLVIIMLLIISFLIYITYCRIKNPDEDDIYTRMGNVHFKMEAYVKSISYYTKAIDINPENGQAYYNRAICHYNLKKTEDACFDAQRAASLGIEEAEIFLSGKCK